MECVSYPVSESSYFRIHVVDAETRRGISLVELRTMSGIAHYTDSAGMIAFHEPGLMDCDVFFQIESHGYTVGKDSAGAPGRTVRTTPGTGTTIEMRRENIAQRLYRITGQGIYIHSLLLGDHVPIRRPLHNSLVDGQDSVLMTRYRDRLFWVWGDTMQPCHMYAGNFKVAAAWSDLPDHGGLDPETGIDLEYVREGDFTREMVPEPGSQLLHWIGSLFVVGDDHGRQRMMAFCGRIEPPLKSVGNMMLEFNDKEEVFDPVVPDWPEDALPPKGHVVQIEEKGIQYLVFPFGGGLTRVKADYSSVLNPDAYEGWSFLKQGSRFDGSADQIERNADGELAWGWKCSTSPVGQEAQAKLESAGLIRRDERTFCIHDAETGEVIQAHVYSVFWNEWRKRWIMIFCQHMGKASMLGELWCAEADRLEGPYVYACRIVTHNKYSFYNPLQHPEFSTDGGRVVFIEGTYTTWFSGIEKPTPRYDYNQIMYKLELDDDRLILPVAIHCVDGKYSQYGTIDHPRPGAAVFHALDRPHRGTVPMCEIARDDGVRLEACPADVQTSPGTRVAFHAYPPETEVSKDGPLAPLFEFSNVRTGARAYATGRPAHLARWKRAERPLCVVWENPLAEMQSAHGKTRRKTPRKQPKG